MKHEAEFNTSDEYIRAYQIEEESQRKAEALAETMAEATHVYQDIANQIDKMLGYFEELKDSIPADYDEDISMLIVKSEKLLWQAFHEAANGVLPVIEPEIEPEPDPGIGRYVWYGTLVESDDEEQEKTNSVRDSLKKAILQLGKIIKKENR